MSIEKTILIAPLDWGLGHATRCMPIIDILLQKNHTVILAGNGDSYFLLKEHYPSLASYELPGYNISYSSGKNASVQSLLQTPKILKTIRAENKVIEKICKKEKINLIISDNRYGVRNKNVKSIFICHQIALQAPKGFQFMNPVFLQLHLHQIHQFDALWIPDTADENNLSGILSHGIKFKIPHTYIGILSRFTAFQKMESKVDAIDFSILVVLSGPEPQRSVLEKNIKNKLSKRTEKMLCVQGKTEQYLISQDKNCTTVSYLNSNDLFAAFQKANTIICRAGYSTIMDLATLGKKAILIPAEGQTEQEYLAKIHASNQNAVACHPIKLDIDTAIEKSKTISGFSKTNPSTFILENELNQLLT